MSAIHAGIRRVAITGSGVVNGMSFNANGSGSGDAATGMWDFSVEFSELPPQVDAFANLLGILIVPTNLFGHEEGDAQNLLTLAGGDCEFTQVVRGEDIAVKSAGTIRRTRDNDLSWDSQSSGQINIKELASADSFDALMLPQGHGKLIDCFALPLINKDRRTVVNVVRNITFSPKAELRQMQLRKIRIRWIVEARKVIVKTHAVIRTMNAPLQIIADG